MLRCLLLPLALLSVGLCRAQQNLVFGYDKAGNQVQRHWEDPTQKADQDSTQTLKDQDDFLAYPSPTNGRFKIRIDARHAAQLTRVRVLLRDGQPVYDQPADQLVTHAERNGLIEIPIDLSRNPLFRAAPLAIVTLSLRDGTSLTKTIAILQP